MIIRFATDNDVRVLLLYDKHISKQQLMEAIKGQRVLIAEYEDKLVGFLRYNLFWDNTPFMNMLYVLNEHRNKSIGATLLNEWEEFMRKSSYKIVMTSTLSNENAQHFYRKFGYKDSGSLLMPNEPLEIIFIKEL